MEWKEGEEGWRDRQQVDAGGCRLPGTEKEGEGRSPRSGTGEEGRKWWGGRGKVKESEGERERRERKWPAARWRSPAAK